LAREITKPSQGDRTEALPPETVFSSLTALHVSHWHVVLASQWLMFTATRVTFSTGAANLMQCGGQHRQPPKRQPVMVSGKGGKAQFKFQPVQPLIARSTSKPCFGGLDCITSYLRGMVALPSVGVLISIEMRPMWGMVTLLFLGVCEGLLIGRHVEFLQPNSNRTIDQFQAA